MSDLNTPDLSNVTFSPLVLADRLISLAQDADRAGYQASATHLLGLAYAVFDEQPRNRN